MNITNLTITFKALERELNLPPGASIVALMHNASQEQFTVKIVCESPPTACAPDRFEQIGEAFRAAAQQQVDESIKHSIHF